ncbi:leucine carboxyl methyltransferase [Hirsutella rhossiliensis]|uniref:Leucine carboxyl methyltransferase 1 n=1 Tax=Hirsutella rhossiliensis TaxID=111463 RepID=A0A9P8N122_9HYPO|nr:leucine carboxyl methyltransferase domain-containing protein [Hirsutella rhossiliensis]KAH0965713.1 leucine carboxyl methyltransferase domain-containing protein [Hirsutella rhossiliensis]
MAAPSIPNLLSMRGGDRGGRGVGGGRAAVVAASAGASPDAVIQDTDTDAAVSRLSAVQLGYLDDPYAECFVSGPPTRRLPIINRGTYVRTRALDMIITAFLSAPNEPGDKGPRQIVALGAGTDTRPFRLLESHSPQELIYHEIDFEPTCRRKYQTVRTIPALASRLEDVEVAESGSWSARWRRGGEYHCHAVDLRHIHESLTPVMGAAIRTNVPTLILSECCLCYLTHQNSERVLDLFQSRIARLAIAVYEPMPLDDSFGKVMMSNLKARKIYMPSLERYRDPRGQEERLRDAGFETVGHATIKDAWETWVDSQEKARLDALEGLDEVEEWQLLAAHYVVAWGAKQTGFSDFGRRAMANMGGRM